MFPFELEVRHISPRAISGAEDGLHYAMICCASGFYLLLQTDLSMQAFICVLNDCDVGALTSFLWRIALWGFLSFSIPRIEELQPHTMSS